MLGLGHVRPAAILVAVLVGCGQSDPTSRPAEVLSNIPPGARPELLRVSLALNWTAEAEHGGFIAARTHGLFRNAGLDVEIIPGGTSAPQTVIAELAAERIQFAISDADNVIRARAAGVPVVALMAPLQNSPRCIIVHESSGITSLEQLADLELAISEARPFARWMKKKLPLTNVTMVPYAGSVGEFLAKPAFAQQGYVFSEPFVAREKGGDPHVLMVSDTGFNPYASCLITTEKIIAEQPELVQAMVTASVHGWDQYLVDSTPTNADINAENSDMSLAVLKFGATQMVPLCLTEPGVPACGMTSARWTTLVRQIEEIEEIARGSVNPDECFTTKFLDAVPAAAPK